MEEKMMEKEGEKTKIETAEAFNNVSDQILLTCLKVNFRYDTVGKCTRIKPLLIQL